jgi:hypothetical protein
LPPDELRRSAAADMESAQPLQEAVMKLVAKLLAVVSALALATPALACGDKTTTAKSEEKSPSQKVAKADAKKAQHAKQHAQQQAKPATAAN